MAKSKSQESALGWLKSIIIAVVIVVVVRTFLFSPVIVDGASMEPTLHDQERIIISKTVSWIGEANRGDIVIIKGKNTKDHYVKRVIALPGDTIEMRNDQLYVNNEKVNEHYLEENKRIADQRGMNLTEDFGPLEIPADQYFVMGDNRVRSMDSRNELGLIEEKRIIGKSKLVIFPAKNIRITQ